MHHRKILSEASGSVTWFVNAKLEARFEAAKELLNSLGIDTTERNLFHGTAAANIQPILEACKSAITSERMVINP